MQEIECTSCKKKFDYSKDFFCTFCSCLNYVYRGDNEEFNYFIYLQIPVSLKIDSIELEKKYLNLMTIYHPDKFVLKSEIEQKNALLHGSYLNSAYNILKQDLTRLAYFYEIFNKELIIREDSLVYSSSIVMEFFDLYEKLENIVTINSYKEFLNELKSLENNIFMEINNLDIKINKEEVQNFYIKLKYLSKIKEKLLQKKAHLK